MSDRVKASIIADSRFLDCRWGPTNATANNKPEYAVISAGRSFRSLPLNQHASQDLARG